MTWIMPLVAKLTMKSKITGAGEAAREVGQPSQTLAYLSTVMGGDGTPHFFSHMKTAAKMATNISHDFRPHSCLEKSAWGSSNLVQHPKMHKSALGGLQSQTGHVTHVWPWKMASWFGATSYWRACPSQHG